ncbi:FAD-binding protein [Arthrobacter sp. zg-ZUI100]|uniref:FAD-binding protein n=1 Tax=Arthrobacter jiangjiafuii TaxID=2817475 RepID=UPI001AEE485D|nr:FAD-binding protein [Arthrobacter jiangjiafuii]MBP3035816.1 FAD-binding protein [Arthrobacter jiangjiafuii]
MRRSSTNRRARGQQADAHTEVTAAVIIGCGLTGLAVASELSRQGVESVVLNGLECDGASSLQPAPDPGSLPERTELLRLLRGYAAGHELDIRRGTAARGLDLMRGTGIPAPVSRGLKWAINTKEGVLLADTVVLTGCGQPQLARLIRSLGFASAPQPRSALRGAGLYLVGAGEAISAPTRELVRQAKRAAQDIAARNAAHLSSPRLRTFTA